LAVAGGAVLVYGSARFDACRFTGNLADIVETIGLVLYLNDSFALINSQLIGGYEGKLFSECYLCMICC
jgi:hypothetical protein